MSKPLKRLLKEKRLCKKCNKTFLANKPTWFCLPCEYRKDLKRCNKKCLDCGKIITRNATRCGSCSNKGRRSNRWTGGRIVSNGYVFIYKGNNHPRVKNKNGNQYVLEHILVMEKHLGRYLYKEENIHHINGIRDDNRIENLELWTKPQPSGIRVEDAIAHAKEVLTRYDKSKEKL
jgi:hypothetical protein